MSVCLLMAMRVSLFLRLSIMNICDFHPPCVPPLLSASSSHSPSLLGEELKHIRPALDFGFNRRAERGRIRRTLSEALEDTGQPLKSSSNPEAFSEYDGYSFGTSPGCRLPNGERWVSLMGKHNGIRWFAIVNYSDWMAATTIEINVGIISIEMKPIIFLFKDRGLYREICISAYPYL